jgi:leucyl/phenylalanyl-tRNA--protein transferase
MPVYRLGDRIAFPPAALASDDGLLAVGGDLRVERLLEAYRNGIFPWPMPGAPLAWWSPDPRFVLHPTELQVPKSLQRVLRKGSFTITVDRSFEAVIRGCRRAERPGQLGTWITGDMVDAYIALHRAGHAHSVEAWQDGALAGGLYGVALGACFFGESMFAVRPDASKCAFVRLVEALAAQNCPLIDCQVHTDHLERFGAGHVPRSRFLRELSEALSAKRPPIDWTALPR